MVKDLLEAALISGAIQIVFGLIMYKIGYMAAQKRNLEAIKKIYEEKDNG